MINNLWAAAYFPIGCPGEVCSTSNPACLSTSITVLLPRKWPKIQVENSTVNQSAPLTHSSFSCWNNRFRRQGYQKLDQLQKHVMQFIVTQTQLFTTAAFGNSQRKRQRTAQYGHLPSYLPLPPLTWPRDWADKKNLDELLVSSSTVAVFHICTN